VVDIFGDGNRVVRRARRIADGTEGDTGEGGCEVLKGSWAAALRGDRMGAGIELGLITSQKVSWLLLLAIDERRREESS
jgi:hypothetical protein